MAATTKRSAAHASTAMTKKDLGYHLLQTLPEGYKKPQPVVNRKRRRTPDINAAPISSSDEESNSGYDFIINNNADGPSSSSSGWRQPTEYATTRYGITTNGVDGKASTTFRDPPSQTEGSAQRRSTRGQGTRSSPKRSRDVIEPSSDDNILDEFGQMRSSQGQFRAKKMRVYGPTIMNIHGSGSVGRAQYSAKGSNATAKSKGGVNDGFRIIDLGAMEEKCKYWQRALCLGIVLTLPSEQSGPGSARDELQRCYSEG